MYIVFFQWTEANGRLQMGRFKAPKAVFLSGLRQGKSAPKGKQKLDELGACFFVRLPVVVVVFEENQRCWDSTRPTFPFFPGILLSRKLPESQGKWPVFENNHG